MGKHGNIFKKIGAQKPINDWAPNLPLGKHRVALKSYIAKESEKDNATIIESEWMILESVDPKVKVGEIYGWAWFVEAPGWAGTYAQRRAKSFLLEVKKAVDDETETEEFGAILAGPDQPGTGIVLDVTVTQVLEKGTREVRTREDGSEIHNANWAAVEQTAEDIAAMKEQIATTAPPAPEARPAAKKPAAAPARAAAKPAPEPPADEGEEEEQVEEEAPPPKPAAKRLGGLGGLGGALGKTRS